MKTKKKIMLGIGRSRGSAPFTPNSIANLKTWLSKSAGTYQNSTMTTPAVAGDPLGGWDDQKNNNDATQTTAGIRPVLQSDGILFTAASTQYLSHAFVGGAEWTLLIRYKKTIGNLGRLLTVSAGGSYIQFLTATQITWYSADGVQNDATGTSAITDDGSFKTMIARYKNTQKNMRINGMQVLNKTGLNNAAGLTMNTIGRYTTNYLDGTISDLLHYERYLTDDECVRLEAAVPF